jgi:hypothetical protein
MKYWKQLKPGKNKYKLLEGSFMVEASSATTLWFSFTEYNGKKHNEMKVNLMAGDSLSIDDNTAPPIVPKPYVSDPYWREEDELVD